MPIVVIEKPSGIILAAFSVFMESSAKLALALAHKTESVLKWNRHRLQCLNPVPGAQQTGNRERKTVRC